jgi:hypothetical protein
MRTSSLPSSLVFVRSPFYSSLHYCRLYIWEHLKKLLISSVRTSSSLAIVCMNDISSSTGYMLNGKHFPPGATYKLGDKRVGSRMIVLRDGDEIQVPGTPQGKFFMMGIWRSRLGMDWARSLVVGLTSLPYHSPPFSLYLPLHLDLRAKVPCQPG